eukprot:52724-Pyramimonas_sp.AAC.1
MGGFSTATTVGRTGEKGRWGGPPPPLPPPPFSSCGSGGGKSKIGPSTRTQARLFSWSTPMTASVWTRSKTRYSCWSASPIWRACR